MAITHFWRSLHVDRTTILVMIRASLFLALVAATISRAPGQQQAESATAIVQPTIEKGRLAGAVVLVTNRDKVLLVEAMGFQDRDEKLAMTTESLFWIASMSKPMTAAALMILVDEGKVSLDDPVAKHLPEFRELWLTAEKTPGQMTLKRPGRAITIRDILSHTSGLPFKSAVEEPTLDIAPLSLVVRSYTMLPLLFEPGMGYQYSNAGINTAGRIIEILSGMPYEQFMADRLFLPLGMKDTSFRPTTAQVSKIAKSYRANNDATGLDEVRISQLKYPLDGPDRYPMPGGGLFSTADDCGRFCRMVLGQGMFDSTRILSEASVVELTRRQTPESVKESYGLGFSVGGDGSCGHGGAHATNMSIDRNRGLAVVWMVQDAGSPPEWRTSEGEVRAWAIKRFSERPEPMQ